MAETENEEGQKPPQVEEKTGVALFGKYPANHRLRAEALARDGISEDPDGVVSPELITDAGKRLSAEDKAAEVAQDEQAKADKALRAKPAAELREIAAAEGVPIESDDNKADLVRKIEDHRAATPAAQ